jgi:E3 ubiquitin-protein ligase HERC3
MVLPAMPQLDALLLPGVRNGSTRSLSARCSADHGAFPGGMGDNLPPINLGTGRTVRKIAAAGMHVCALLDNWQVKCWGDNNTYAPPRPNTGGQLGQGDTVDRGALPGQMGDGLPNVELGSGRLAKDIAIGVAHSCALLDNGKVKCWGQGSNGKLGLGDTIDRGWGPGQMGDSLPSVDLGSTAVVIGISASGNNTCALLDTAPVKCWGYNREGQLGVGDSSDRGDNPGEMGDALPVVGL